MKSSNVLKLIKNNIGVVGDVDVDLSDGNGLYESIIDIRSRKWVDNNGRNHCVIEILHNGSYEPEESVVNNIKGRNKTEEEIDWKEIKVGDIVLEGLENEKYRVLTSVDGTYWEYFDPVDGYYHSTSPEYCHWLVKGQKNAGGKLLKIVFNNQ